MPDVPNKVKNSHSSKSVVASAKKGILKKNSSFLTNTSNKKNRLNFKLPSEELPDSKNKSLTTLKDKIKILGKKTESALLKRFENKEEPPKFAGQ